MPVATTAEYLRERDGPDLTPAQDRRAEMLSFAEEMESLAKRFRKFDFDDVHSVGSALQKTAGELEFAANDVED